MKTDSLRSEYVLTGGALLGSLAVVAMSADRAGWVADLDKHADWLAKESPLVALGLLLGAAYILGILCVQLTFFFPTEGLIAVRRSQRLAELRATDSSLRARGWVPQPTGEHAAILSSLFATAPAIASEPAGRVFWRTYKRKRDDLVKIVLRRSVAADSELDSVVLSLGRHLSTEEVTREYEYRRSNRQIFIGVLPSAVILVAAGAVNPYTDHHVLNLVLRCLAVVLGGILVSWMMFSASYQEKVAQSQLLDAAFIRRWKDAHQAPAGTS